MFRNLRFHALGKNHRVKPRAVADGLSQKLRAVGGKKSRFLPDYGILDIPAPAAWIGKTLRELNIRAKLGVNIIAVESGKKTNVAPSADYQIQPGDVMVVLGDNYSLEAVQKL